MTNWFDLYVAILEAEFATQELSAVLKELQEKVGTIE